MNNKSRIIRAISGFIISFIITIIASFLAEYKIANNVFAVAVVTVSMILLFISTWSLCRIDYETGLYECKNCGHSFQPTFKAYIFGAHTPTKRRLECPECKHKTWCKRKQKEL